MPPHPIQPLVRDAGGVVRFRANAIVQHLLDHGGIDLNGLACLDFPSEDREQFAQLIGYSVSGFGDLSYASPEVVAAADLAAGDLLAGRPASPEAQRLEVLDAKLARLRETMRDAVSELYGLHPDDL